MRQDMGAWRILGRRSRYPGAFQEGGRTDVRTVVGGRMSLVLFLLLAFLTPSTLAQDEDVPGRRYLAAVTLVNRGSYDEAVRAWQQFLDQYPRDPRADRASYYLGVCQEQQKKHSAAAATFRKLVAEHPKSDRVEAALWRLGIVLWTMAHQDQPPMYPEAQATFESLLAKYPQGQYAPEATYYRAECLYARGEKRQAVAAYRQVAERWPKDAVAPRALYLAAHTAMELGQHDEAIAEARTFHSTYRDHPLLSDVIQVGAESCVALGKFEAADKLYAQLLERFGQHGQADRWTLRRGAVLVAGQKYAEAIQVLEPLAARLRGPDELAQARHLIGVCQAQRKEPIAAARSFVAAIEAQPQGRKIDETWLALAEAFRQAGDLDKARQAAERLVAAFPQSGVLDRAHFLIAQCQRIRKDVAAAETEYRLVADRWPKSPLAPKALHELGCIRLERKDAAGAESTLSALLEKYPADPLVPLARYARGMARHEQGKLVAAAEDLEAALAAETTVERSNARFLLGLCRMELKSYSAAVITFRALLADDSVYPAADRVYYELGVALEAEGQQAEAEKSLARLPAEFPNSPWLVQAQFRLGELAYQRRDFAAAVKAFYAVVKKGDDTPLAEKAMYRYGLAEYHLGDFDLARKVFGHQIKRFPEGPLAFDAMVAQAECLIRQDKLDEAIALCEQVIAKADGEPAARAQFRIGQAQLQSKNPKEAIRSFLKAAYGYSDYPQWQADALLAAAGAHESLGRRAEAIKLHRELLQKYPKSDKAPQAKERLKELETSKGD